MPFKKLFLLFVAASCVLGLEAQETMELGLLEYRKMVLDSNLAIQAADNQFQASLYRIDANRMDQWPLIDFNFLDLFNSRKVTNEGTPVNNRNIYNAGIEVAQNFYSGGIVKKNIELARILARQALAGKELTEYEIIYLADVAYWTAISAKEELNIWRQYRERFEEFYQTIVDRVEAEIVSRNEQLTAQVQLNDIDQQILRVERTSEIAQIGLKRLAYISPSVIFNLQDSIVVIDQLPDTINLRQSAFSKRPEIRLLQEQVNVNLQREKIVRAPYLPSVGASLRGGYGNGIIGEPQGGFNLILLGQVNVPITRWGKMRKELEESRLFTLSSQQLLQDEKAQIDYEITETFYNLQQSVRQVNLGRVAVQDAVANLRVYLDRYDEGLASIVEVTDAQTFLQNAIVQLFRHRTSYQFSIVDFNRAIGTLMD